MDNTTGNSSPTTGPEGPDTTSAARPTIVLVHGAFAESASWNGVIAGLLDRHYPVVAVANPLRGVRTDAAYLDSVLAALDTDVVLVAHSYGGMVTSNVTYGRVQALVYVGAFAPDTGDSAATLSGRFPGSTLADTLMPVTLPDANTDLYIQQDRYHAQFAADSAAADAAVMAVTQRPITQAALQEPSADAAWRRLPSWFLFGSEDRNIPVAVHRFMAERAGSRRTVELAGGSHTVAIPESATVVDLIEQAAAAVSTSVAAH
jgi:pimeloyl-ACP methyl ester carboxylesterase